MENTNDRKTEDNTLTRGQFTGIIKMVIALLKEGAPAEEVVEYLEEIIKE